MGTFIQHSPGMKKPARRIIRLLLLILAGILMYIIGVLAINTALDYKPEGGELDVHDFQELDGVFSGDTLSIVSWNLGYGGLGDASDFFYDGGKMARPNKEDFMRYQHDILTQIRAFDSVNLLLLQELDINSKRSYEHNQYQLIRDELTGHAGCFVKNYDVAFVPLPAFSPMGKVESGLAFFSNRRVVASAWEAYEGGGSWPLNLFMPDRCYSFTVFDIAASGLLYVFNTHNSAFDDGSQRDIQLEQLYAVMKNAYDAGNYVIAGGDWNINPAGYEEKRFSSGDISFRIQGLQQVEGPGPAWKVVFDPAFPTNRDVSSQYLHGQTPTTILDFFVCSPNISVLDARTIYNSFACSDHHPVYMQFVFD